MVPAPLAVIFSTPLAALATVAGAASVPVIIHLFNRRRYRVVDWAAMRFLQAAIKRNVRRLRLEHWLLLAVRALLVALPALAMAAAMPWAEPAWQRLFPGAAPPVRFTGRTHHVIVFDATLSMTARGDDASAFERAQAAAAEFVARCPAGDGFSVVLLASPPRPVIPGPADDAARVSREIGDLVCTHGPADLNQTIASVEDIVGRQPGKYARRVVYLFTDLQRSQWVAPSSSAGSWAEAWQRLHARADVGLVDVGRPEGGNFAVTSLTLADSLITSGSRSALTATVHNFGATEHKQLRVELWQAKTATAGRMRPGDEPYPPRVVRQELVDVAGGSTATLSFPVEFRAAGDYLLEVRIESDGLTADDRRALPVTVRDTLQVLLVNGQPAASGLDTTTGWLAAALNPFPDGTRSAQYPVRPTVVDEAKLGDPNVELNRYDAVILADVARPTPRDRDRLDGYLRRGGTVIIGLGPRVDPEAYNRLLFQNGDGLLPAKLLSRQRAAAEQFFLLTADDEAFRRPPLAAFAADDDRAALTGARFKEFWRLELSPKVASRRLVQVYTTAGANDPLLVEWSRGRGRVFVYSSTFSTEWTGWPVAPSYPPFVQEFIRYAARSGPRRELLVGEAIDESLPDGVAATEAVVTTPSGATATVPLAVGQEAPRLHFTDTDRSGIYTASIAGIPPLAFAVNVPPGGESELRRVAINELPATGTGEESQIVTDPRSIRQQVTDATAAAVASDAPGALGSAVARVLLLAALVVLFAEPIIAWRLGSAREPAAPVDRPAATMWRRTGDACLALLSAAPLLIVAFGAAVLAHAAWGGELLGFLPGSWRSAAETALGVPPAAPGEGTRWRLDRLPVFTGDAHSDAWLVTCAAVAALALAGWVYYGELRRASRLAGAPLVTLRLALVVTTLFVLLPQLRLVFEREGWPDLAVVIDDSQSMGVSDDYTDPAMRAAVTRLAGSDSASRLALAQRLLGKPGREWIARLVRDRQTRLHVFRASDHVSRLAEIESAEQAASAASAVSELKATGPSSRLGDAVRGVVQEFRGSSLAGVIVLTDGVTTDGEELSQAARHALRAGVPLTFVGIGDAREPRDLALTDLRVDDVVRVGDRLVFEARLTAYGGAGGPVVVVLAEKQGDQRVELARVEVNATAGGGPARVRVVYAPREPGERTYVLEAVPQPGESDTSNNRLERSVTVSEFRRTRVLLIDGKPRYDYRAIKTLLERENEAIRGNKSVELKVLLGDADPDYPRQDRSALEAFPATREELYDRFDVMILGDIDPEHPLLGEKHLQWLADFVREKGGGLLLECGSRYMPAAYTRTPLAPVLPADVAPGEMNSTVRPEGYRPRLTAIGRSHPVLRFATDEADNIEAWAKLQPIFWAVSGLRPRPAAEVLATLPVESGSAEGPPLIVQHFVGAGRAMILGFDETWRWRYRGDEVKFNEFWLQAVRYLARTRIGRPEIRLDRQTAYRRGEPIKVTVRFPEDKPPPPADAVVRVNVEYTTAGGAAHRQSLQLAAVAGSRASYEAVVTRTPEGEYKFTLATSEAGPVPTAEARVLPPLGEMDRLRMNRPEMERAAQVSRGRFYTVADADQLIDELPPSPRVTLDQPRPPWPLWNTPAAYALVLGLACAEWVLRKRQQLL